MSQQHSHMGPHGGSEGNGFRFLFHIYVMPSTLMFYFLLTLSGMTVSVWREGETAVPLLYSSFLLLPACRTLCSIHHTSCASLNNREHAEGSEARWRISAQTGYCGTGIKASRTTMAAVPGPLCRKAFGS